MDAQPPRWLPLQTHYWFCPAADLSIKKAPVPLSVFVSSVKIVGPSVWSYNFSCWFGQSDATFMLSLIYRSMNFSRVFRRKKGSNLLVCSLCVTKMALFWNKDQLDLRLFRWYIAILDARLSIRTETNIGSAFCSMTE